MRLSGSWGTNWARMHADYSRWGYLLYWCFYSCITYDWYKGLFLVSIFIDTNSFLLSIVMHSKYSQAEVLPLIEAYKVKAGDSAEFAVNRFALAWGSWLAKVRLCAFKTSRSSGFYANMGFDISTTRARRRLHWTILSFARRRTETTGTWSQAQHSWCFSTTRPWSTSWTDGEWQFRRRGLGTRWTSQTLNLTLFCMVETIVFQTLKRMLNDKHENVWRIPFFL